MVRSNSKQEMTEFALLEVITPSLAVGQYCEITPCASRPCLNGGNCTDLVSGYRCTCPPAYAGLTCATPYCRANDPCQHGGTCHGAGLCNCPLGYTGHYCEVTPCTSQPCLNGGTCTDLVAGYNCTCPSDYTGRTCATFCSTNSLCRNGGAAFNSSNTFKVSGSESQDQSDWNPSTLFTIVVAGIVIGIIICGAGCLFFVAAVICSRRRKKRSSEDRDAATMTNSAEYYSQIASVSRDNRRDSDISTGTYLNEYSDIHLYTRLDGIADSSV